MLIGKRGVAVAKRGSGRVEEEPAGPQDWGDDWVHKLIAMTRPGAEIEFPKRALGEPPLPFAYDYFS
jgi:hypothetical protein